MRMLSGQVGMGPANGIAKASWLGDGNYPYICPTWSWRDEVLITRTSLGGTQIP